MFTESNNTLACPLRPSQLGLIGLLLFGVLTLGPSGAQAQAQIDQVQTATQDQLSVTLPGACEPGGKAQCQTVTRPDVLGLLPARTPPLLNNGPGSDAVIVQRGSYDDATVRQAGAENKASITQLNGNENTATVEQGPGGGLPGVNNLAVIVQHGSLNRTTVQQRGKNNLAGIRVVGNDNGLSLRQTGTNNKYLLDFSGSGLGSTGNSAAHQISQIGSNNRLVQVGEGQMPFSVRQRGDDMRMVIRHDRK